MRGLLARALIPTSTLRRNARNISVRHFSPIDAQWDYARNDTVVGCFEYPSRSPRSAFPLARSLSRWFLFRCFESRKRKRTGEEEGSFHSHEALGVVWQSRITIIELHRTRGSSCLQRTQENRRGGGGEGCVAGNEMASGKGAGLRHAVRSGVGG